MAEKFDVHYDPDLDLRIARILGPVSIDEFREMIAAHFDSPVAKYVMWHFYPGSLGHFDLDDLKDLMTWRKEALQKRAGGCTIQVADDEEERRLLRWNETFVKTLPFHQVSFFTCTTEEEGLEIVRRYARAK